MKYVTKEDLNSSKVQEIAEGERNNGSPLDADADDIRGTMPS